MRKTGILTLTLIAFLLGGLALPAQRITPDSTQTDSTEGRLGSAVSIDSLIGLKAQSDSLSAAKKAAFADSLAMATAQDSSKKKRSKTARLPGEYDPRKAWRRSAIIPGWGQVYNRRPWKVPIIYAGFAGLGVSIAINHRSYKNFQELYRCSYTESCEFFPVRDGSVLLSAREFYRRNRDLSAILTVFWYSLNVIEAYIDAHLREFDISEDLSFEWRPDAIYLRQQNKLGVGLNFTFTIR